MPDQWELASKKLFELTEAGTLKWHRLDSQLITGGDISGLAFLTETSGKMIVAYEEKTFGEDGFQDGTRPVIEFVVVDPEDRYITEWRWPGTYSQYRLLDSIRFHVAEGEEFLKHSFPRLRHSEFVERPISRRSSPPDVRFWPETIARVEDFGPASASHDHRLGLGCPAGS